MAECPGPGTYERKRTTEGIERSDKKEHPIFKDSTDRDGHMSYIDKERKKIGVAPNDYFTDGRPFLKKSYNASLPQPKFV